MRLEQLEYLVAISQSNSLNEASKRLYISQQSLGKAIKNLEDELNVPLLVRTHNGCYLTKEGREVVDDAKEILWRISDLKTRYNVCSEVSGDVIVLACPVVHEAIMPNVLKLFQQSVPHTKITVIEKDTLLIPDMHKRMASCSDNTVISVLNIPNCLSELKRAVGPGSGLVFRPIVNDYWVACLNKRHPLANAPNLTLKMLLNEWLVVEYPDYPEYGIDYATLDYYTEHGSLKVNKVVDSQELMYSSITNDNYVGFATYLYIAKSDIGKRYPDVVFRNFTPTIDSQFGCLFSEDVANSRLCSLFFSILESQMLKENWH